MIVSWMFILWKEEAIFKYHVIFKMKLGKQARTCSVWKVWASTYGKRMTKKAFIQEESKWFRHYIRPKMLFTQPFIITWKVVHQCVRAWCPFPSYSLPLALLFVKTDERHHRAFSFCKLVGLSRRILRFLRPVSLLKGYFTLKVHKWTLR